MKEQRDPTYYRAVARAMGVPEFWIEDAAQDIALATWRDGKPGDVLAIRREAIDAARRYGRHSRGKAKPTHLPLDAAAKMGEPPDESYEVMQAMKTVFGSLTPKQRRALRRRIERLPMSNSDSARASAARKKLRKELSGE
jgi:DNA-directed RNA polymerase specialized sigma24 family protein